MLTVRLSMLPVVVTFGAGLGSRAVLMPPVPQPPQVAPRTRSAAAQVYAVVLGDSAGRVAAPLWVEAATVRVPRDGLLGMALKRPRQPAALAALVERLAAASAVPGDARRLALPAAVRVVDSAESRRLQDAGHGGAVVYALSPVAFTDDSTQALVYVERRSGALCGGGEAVLLARTPAGRWERRRAVASWLG